MHQKGVERGTKKMSERISNDAFDVYTATHQAVAEEYGGVAKSTYLIGSLAHGGFSEHTSDIDVAFVLDKPDITDGDWSTFDYVGERIKNDRGLRFGKKLSLFWSTLPVLSSEITSGAFPAPTKDQGVFPPYDVLDLIQHGKLLHGEEVRGSLREPTVDNLYTAGVEFLSSYVDTSENNDAITDHDAFDSLSNHDKSKLVLFPVRLMYTLNTGKIGDNAKAAEHYIMNLAQSNQPDTESGGSSRLLGQAVEQAILIRDQDAFDEKIMKESFPAIMDLYSQLINQHKDKMQLLGQTEHAQDLDDWLSRLKSLSEKDVRG